MGLFRLAALVFVAVTCVVIGDAAGSLLTRAGVAPAFVAWARFALAAVVLVPMAGIKRAELKTLIDWRVLARGAVIAAGINCILTALRSAPIADVYGTFFIGPVISTLLAIVFLGERPSPLRLALLGLGFVGVLLVVKPGFGMGPGVIFALAAGCCYGAYLALTRAVAGVYRPRLLLASQLLIGALLLAPPALVTPLLILTPWHSVLLGISAAGSALGNYLLVNASRRAEASLIAPLVYSQLISAAVMGYLVYRDVPDTLAMAGLALIVTSGFGALNAGRSDDRSEGSLRGQPAQAGQSAPLEKPK